MINGDVSSASMSVSQPVGDTWRSAGSSFFNQGNIASEDWQRSEQSAMLAFERDLKQMNLANEFTANEAQKNRDFQERMSNTAYQRAVDDMKKAGINPILAFQQGGASTPSGSSANSSSPNRGSNNTSKSYSDALVNLMSGLIRTVGTFALFHSGK